MCPGHVSCVAPPKTTLKYATPTLLATPHCYQDCARKQPAHTKNEANEIRHIPRTRLLCKYTAYKKAASRYFVYAFACFLASIVLSAMPTYSIKVIGNSYCFVDDKASATPIQALSPNDCQALVSCILGTSTTAAGASGTVGRTAAGAVGMAR
jgi:hypothetical protein